MTTSVSSAYDKRDSRPFTTECGEIAEDVISRALEAIVSYPADVRVRASPARKTNNAGWRIALTISVHPDDIGLVIGTEGERIKAIRTLLTPLGARFKVGIFPYVDNPRDRRRFDRDDDYEDRQDANIPSGK